MNYSIETVLQALVDPSRRQIVERLGAGSTSVSELARPLDMSLPRMLHHLSVLETSGIVTTKKTGRVRTCQLQIEPICAAETWFSSRREAWERRLDDLGDYLEATAPAIPHGLKETE